MGLLATFCFRHEFNKYHEKSFLLIWILMAIFEIVVTGEDMDLENLVAYLAHLKIGNEKSRWI